MKRLFVYSIFFLLSTMAYSQVADWENQYIFGRNKEYYRVQVIPYADVNQALSRNKTNSPYYKLLSGKWKFKRVANERGIPQNFFDPAFSVSQWDDIQVPGSVELQNFGTPIFKNAAYPFDPALPPFIPHVSNPVNLYRTTFTVPDDWKARKIYIAFNGIESAYYLYINGKKVGYSENSYSTSEFDINQYLTSGENTLAVENYRFFRR